MCPNQESYLPCECQIQNYNQRAVFELNCKNASVFKIRKALNLTTPADFDRINLQLLATEYSIPQNLLFNHRVTNSFNMKGFHGEHSYRTELLPRLKIHPDAFKSSRNVILEFILDTIDMSKLELSFLTDFNVLRSFAIQSSINVHLNNIPPLPCLTKLEISYSKGLNEWSHFPQLIAGLRHLYLHNNGLTNEVIDWILEWVLRSPSNDTLAVFYLSGNELTRIPGKLEEFPTLNRIHLEYQKGPGFGNLTAIPLPSLGADKYLELRSCGITHIQPGIFHGNAIKILYINIKLVC